MSDRRLTPANERVAAASLRGRVDAPRYVEGSAAGVTAPVVDLCAAPGGPRDRQLLAGAAVTVFEREADWAFVQSEDDGYVGYVKATSLGTTCAPTHRVTARATHVYPRADIKSPEGVALPMGARVAVLTRHGRFAETAHGFVPAAHLSPLDERAADPVEVAERLVGTPYLWGGNSAFGIDCSGLVQLALALCGRSCPGDSDLQERALGETQPPGTPARRGDLLFWKGHVAWVADPDTILHANVHHMAVAYEAREGAIARIEAQGDGAVTRHARLA
ncbi:C40 family peptidase [Citreimonas salinaria]|uniref:NlpC/P60 family protein n=1 Tax=Citreimonas salinaria TaxID=321339 RepID=A0A1H3FKS3_9RHOB|nr:NlpC/P60 family protein [Citreimonas salinaria]SDX90968.1 NlpC/P60 family protein [Citreimonas salinaria]